MMTVTTTDKPEDKKLKSMTEMLKKNKRPERKRAAFVGKVETTLDANDQIKRAIAREISDHVAARGLTQRQAAEILGSNQAKVSDIVCGRLSGYSVGRLVNFLISLGYDVDIHLLKRGTDRGRVTVHSPIARQILREHDR